MLAVSSLYWQLAIIDICSGLDEVRAVESILVLSTHPIEATKTLKCKLTAAGNLTLVPF
jgi:hypothetical protein